MINIFIWIDKHIEQKITVADIVKISGYSKRHLHNIFVQHSGKAVAEYIRLKKLQRASFFLKLTNLSVIEISERFNFDSPQTFSQVFKKYYAMPPMDYRKSTQWGKNIFFKDPSKKNNILYDFVKKENEEFFGETFYFHMDITKYGDFWDTTQQKIDQMRTNSFNHLYIQKLKSAITFFPHIKRKIFLTVEYIYGEEISRKNGGQRIIVPGGIYLKASKVGRINDFHDFSNTLYRDVLYAFNIKRRNERDYE